MISLQLLIRSLKGVVSALEMEYDFKKEKAKLEELKNAKINQQSD